MKKSPKLDESFRLLKITKMYVPQVPLGVLAAVLVLKGQAHSATLLGYDFTGENTLATSTADLSDSNLDSATTLTRGAGATASAGANSFRTTGFQNNGISTANTDYFQFSLSAATGFSMSVETLDARFAGTAGYTVSPGVSSQFAYSLDGSTFTLIGSPQVTTGTPATLTQINLSGISALQNVAAATTVTFRYYASGQTTTGGWGFNSPSSGSYGLLVGGTLSAVASGTNIFWDANAATLGSGNAGGNWSAANWNSVADGTGTPGNFTADQPATFAAGNDGTGSYTVSVDTTVSASGLIFEEGNVTIANAGGSLTLTGASTVNVAGGATPIISQAIAGSVGLTKTGTGVLVLSGTNEYAGNTTISAGTLQIGNGSTTGEISGSVTNAGTLAFNRSNDFTFAGNITGAGSVTKNGAGTLTLSGVNSYVGGTTVSGGGLTGTTGSLQGGIVNNAAVTFDQGGDGIYAGNMSGSGTLTKTGAGVVTVTGTNSYSGGTTVSAGGLIGTTASLQGAILNNSAVTFDQGNVGTYAGDLTGSGTLAKSGAGTVTLSGTNSYSGGTTVIAGGLTGTTTSLQGNIANSGVVTFDQSSTGTYSGNLSGSGSLAKSGSGTLTLGGTNSHSGSTTVNAGTLVAGNASSLGSSVVTIKGGSLLADSGLTISNNIVADAVTNSAFTATYNFTAGNTVALTTGTGFTAIDLTRGNYNGIPTGSDALPSTTSAAGTGSGTFNAPIAAVGGTLNTATSAYFEFALDATTASSVTLNDISFLSRSTSSGPLAYTLRSSADGYTADIATGAFLANSVYAAESNTGLGINGDLITYRLFGSGGTAAASVTSSSSNWRIDDLVLSGTTQTAGTATIGGISSTGTTTYSGGVSLVSNAVLSAASGGSTAFTGVISGSGSITTSGGGQVTLSGSNTYSGTTTISAGKLALGASNVIPGTQVVLSGGTLLTEGFSNTTSATLKLSSGSIIDLSNNSSVLSFADSKGVAWTGGLAIWNWSGSLTGGGSEQISFSAAGLTSEQLGAVTFLNPAGLDAGTYGAQFIGNELVPVPEVGALFGALGLLAPLAWRERRHWMRCREARVA
jgi:fibronectin-binding autotransporter adhesin